MGEERGLAALGGGHRGADDARGSQIEVFGRLIRPGETVDRRGLHMAGMTGHRRGEIRSGKGGRISLGGHGGVGNARQSGEGGHCSAGEGGAGDSHIGSDIGMSAGLDGARGDAAMPSHDDILAGSGGEVGDVATGADLCVVAGVDTAGEGAVRADRGVPVAENQAVCFRYLLPLVCFR